MAVPEIISLTECWDIIKDNHALELDICRKTIAELIKYWRNSNAEIETEKAFIKAQMLPDIAAIMSGLSDFRTKYRDVKSNINVGEAHQHLKKVRKALVEVCMHDDPKTVKSVVSKNKLIKIHTDAYEICLDNLEYALHYLDEYFPKK